MRKYMRPIGVRAIPKMNQYYQAYSSSVFLHCDRAVESLGLEAHTSPYYSHTLPYFLFYDIPNEHLSTFEQLLVRDGILPLMNRVFFKKTDPSFRPVLPLKFYPLIPKNWADQSFFYQYYFDQKEDFFKRDTLILFLLALPDDCDYWDQLGESIKKNKRYQDIKNVMIYISNPRVNDNPDDSKVNSIEVEKLAFKMFNIFEDRSLKFVNDLEMYHYSRFSKTYFLFDPAFELFIYDNYFFHRLLSQNSRPLIPEYYQILKNDDCALLIRQSTFHGHSIFKNSDIKSHEELPFLLSQNDMKEVEDLVVKYFPLKLSEYQKRSSEIDIFPYTKDFRFFGMDYLKKFI